MKTIIREAMPQEHEVLTQISFAAKRHWDYPESYFDIWEDELKVSEAYISENNVFVVVVADAIAAYYSIVEVKEDFFAGKTFVQEGFWLEHMFVIPHHIGKGIGCAMYAHAKKFCMDSGIDQLRIFADPNAKGFYEKMGAQFLRECPSSIEGRSVSLFIETL